MKGTPSTQIYTPVEMAKVPKTEINFTPVLEDWNIYKLPDGSRTKIKMVVGAVFRAKDRYDQFGDPMYLVNASNVVIGVPKP